MNRSKYILILVIIIFNTTSVAQNLVSITIDDLPVVSYDINDTLVQQKVTSNLLNSLKKHHVPAIGFVNESKLYHFNRLQAIQVSMLRQWLEAGQELGNHTYSHLDYHKSFLMEFKQEIMRGHMVCKPLAAEYHKNISYFRHPYLHIGESNASYDSLKTMLNGLGYQIAPVSIDNEDYLFAKAYHQAMLSSDSTTMHQIGKDYVNYMGQKLKYFEGLSLKLFQRNITHVLIIHANALNASYLDELIHMFQRNKYTFITLEEALKDPAYKTEITKFGPWGNSWIERWAMSTGAKGDYFKGDIETPIYIKIIAEK